MTMDTSTHHATATAKDAEIESPQGRSHTTEATNRDMESIGGASSSPQIEERNREDPLGLRDGAPLAFAAYKVAVECHAELSSRTLGEEAVIQRLCKLAPKSAFEIDYVARQTFKLINPHGHGANSPRFRDEALGWFRNTYPELSHFTAGFIMLLCTAIWWIHDQGHRAVIPRMSPLTTSDLDAKLKTFGFLLGERQAICRMFRREPRHW